MTEKTKEKENTMQMCCCALSFPSFSCLFIFPIIASFTLLSFLFSLTLGETRWGRWKNVIRSGPILHLKCSCQPKAQVCINVAMHKPNTCTSFMMC